MDVKFMNIKEFCDYGFLQEANRKFFHPLGIELQMITKHDNDKSTMVRILDNRDNPELAIFKDNTILQERIDNIEKLRKRQLKNRNTKPFDKNGVQKLV